MRERAGGEVVSVDDLAWRRRRPAGRMEWHRAAAVVPIRRRLAPVVPLRPRSHPVFGETGDGPR